MGNELEEFFTSIIVFLFALFFYYTSTLEQCTYRRLVFPVMFILLALMQWENALAVLLLAVAAMLTYYGYKGYGRQVLAGKLTSS